MAIKITRPQGTEDITPKQIYKWHTVERMARETAESFGFHEMRIPTFESTDLFLRSVGETTDVVQKEMYTVKAKETEFTLRPEGTAGSIRSMLQNGLLNDALPQKIFYILSCFRHERPQAGRLREFHQFGVEMAGSAGPASDAEIIALAKAILDRAGLKNIALNINSIGCPTCRAEYHKALRAYFQPHRDELCETCQTRLEKNPMRILDCKSEICSGIAKDAPIILDYLCDECRTHFEKLQEYLKAQNIEYTINPKIVRGLDYYTKTVFEFITTDIGAQGTVCGGGRYDGLIEQMGGKPTPAMGFAMGLERLILTMESQGCEFQPPHQCDLYIAPMDEVAIPTAMQIASSLRTSGYQVEYDLMQRKLKAQMKYADKIGATFVLVLGENELQSQQANLKNMKTKEQFPVSLGEKFEEKFDDIAIQYMFHDVVNDFEKECGTHGSNE
ncbi:histidine--tRNA ligase [uncultured Ruminococcus sp.]|uniref:histidine--tRNA ligase n=1 Tax=uncultured Ruminococcus sp. TaxID=165186 RepID=UPI0026740B49|nr:histidine--tRNA ligase [uncultured Ruminococcus sp.]